MSPDLEFVAATPESTGPRLDGHSIHLWRVPYSPSRGRAPLVGLLAAYLGIPAADVALEQDAKGKPRLKPAIASCQSHRSKQSGSSAALSFNWSHSGDYALVALSRGSPLGVDIERLGKNQRSLEIARRFFDPEEADTLAPLDADARDRAFIELWCAKEAVLKAVGEGLSFGLARLAFARRKNAHWVLTRVDPELGHARDWQLAGFRAAPDYRGALAWRGEPHAITAFRPAGDPC